MDTSPREDGVNPEVEAAVAALLDLEVETMVIEQDIIVRLDLVPETESTVGTLHNLVNNMILKILNRVQGPIANRVLRRRVEVVWFLTIRDTTTIDCER